MTELQEQIKDQMIVEKYFRNFPKYKRLSQNLKQHLEYFFQEQDISYLTVKSRVKGLDKFLQKILRKKYKNPFIETEDLCGVRVICYFQSDIKKLERIIRREFEVLESFSKEDLYSPSEFGYRSRHFIVRIKKDWLQIPNYKGLENLKAEIQVRTVLMDAWAEIEHKFAYKKNEHIPIKFRRQFSRLSAKLEEADEQFEDLAKKITVHQKRINKKLKKRQGFDETLELNLDNLQYFFDYHFPDKNNNIRITREFLDKALRSELTMKDLVNLYEKDDAKFFKEKTSS